MENRSNAKRVILPDLLFDGVADAPQSGMAVVIEGGHITAVRMAKADDQSAPHILSPAIAAPGFIDLQINGAGGMLFNDSPTPETIECMITAARQGGTAYLLPTFITQAGTGYKQAIAAVDTAMAAAMPGVLGLHLEGPFISPKSPGIHPADAIRKLTEADLDTLCQPFSGKLLITLAPEEVTEGVIRRLANAGLIVFAGHSLASYECMQRASAEGLRGGTHIFNAMSQCRAREPGVVGALLDISDLFAGIIADGHHVHSANLRLAVQKISPDRLFLVTDAMPTLGSSSNFFNLLGKDIYLRDGVLSDASGQLAGAHIAMDEAVRNMISMCGLSAAAALSMASTTPARALGLQADLGVIRPGARAGLTLMDKKFYAIGVISDGAVFMQQTRR